MKRAENKCITNSDAMHKRTTTKNARTHTRNKERSKKRKNHEAERKMSTDDRFWRVEEYAIFIRYPIARKETCSSYVRISFNFLFHSICSGLSAVRCLHLIWWVNAPPVSSTHRHAAKYSSKTCAARSWSMRCNDGGSQQRKQQICFAGNYDNSCLVQFSSFCLFGFFFLYRHRHASQCALHIYQRIISERVHFFAIYSLLYNERHARASEQKNKKKKKPRWNRLNLILFYDLCWYFCSARLDIETILPVQIWLGFGGDDRRQRRLLRAHTDNVRNFMNLFIGFHLQTHHIHTWDRWSGSDMVWLGQWHRYVTVSTSSTDRVDMTISVSRQHSVECAQRCRWWHANLQ